MTYCQEIHQVPPEDSWIVPLDIIQREIPPRMLILVNPEKGHIKDGVELVNHFQQEKISVQYVGTLATKKTTCPNRNAP